MFVVKKANRHPKSILFLPAFFPENAGYHWRVKLWAEELEKAGYKVDILSAIEKNEFYNLLKNNRTKFFITFLKRRFKHVLMARKFETVIVRRELLLYNDYGNLFLDKLLLKIHDNVILDFDDDIAAAKNQPKKITNRYGKIMGEEGNKFNDTLRLYKKFIVASNYLKDKVSKENIHLSSDNILVIPTCVDYNNYTAKQYPSEIKKLAFGWIGGDHNYFLLDTLLPTLNKLSKTYNFKLIVIGGEKYSRDTDFEIEFIQWSLETEIENLYKIDVGLMPLLEDERSKGKGGFKLIQYMGLGIVSVASAITINREIVEDGISSFLIYNSQDWEDTLIQLLKGEIDFETVGKKANKNIINNYTFKANFNRYENFIKK
ncbi:glycosyltransferase family 4 protein [Brumimicrobium mesophilum]|uniref:glycosyltransferase family 4 protein n=1 Tax=Brumimicrobium mesophilum TaxID=392717 RepID=UPI000D142060|nr:glycosyltransferase family 4 protein [Brumimicrobium mesophilum]